MLAPRNVQPGDVLADRFVIEEHVGKGGAGTVFRAWDLDRECAVAVKLLTRLSPTDLERFGRESRLLAECRVAGIVQHVANGVTHDGAPYLVMQWLHGETVAARMEHRGFDVADAAALIAGVCRPLAVLHARGLVHRDLKPENLILTSDDPSDVVVIDFGLARDTRTVETRLTATGVALGTPGYMAPEQIRGERSDVRCDVFALGCILYEALTGYAAFAGENYFAVRAKVLLSQPPPLRALCRDVPEPLIALVDRMMAKAVDARPASAADVARELAALGRIAPGDRRRWNADCPPTRPHDIVRPAVEPVNDRAHHGGVAVVQLAAHVEGVLSGFERFDDGGMILARTHARSDLLAKELADVVLAACERVPGSHAVIVVGATPLELLVDRASRMLEQQHRARVVARETAAAVVCDRATAALLASDFDTIPAGRDAIRLRPR